MDHGIFLRCHTSILNEKPQQKGGKKKRKPLSKYVLVLDTETTTDALQKLNFGVYQFCEKATDGKYRCLEEGIFYADDLSSDQQNILRTYVGEQNAKRLKDELKLKLYERRVFVEKVMYTAIQARAAIVAFKLGFFALIRPEADILPVRTIYGDHQSSDQTNIGLNPLTSDKPVWFAGPDIVGSMLLKEKPPQILRAIRIEPLGAQKGMKSVTLGTGSINPYRDDFFRKVIEERKGKSKNDPLYYFLKILANAGCYGIYAEVNKLQVGKNKAKKIGTFWEN